MFWVSFGGGDGIGHVANVEVFDAMALDEERMECGLHHAHIGAGLHPDDDVLEKALSKDTRSGGGVGQPDGVVHIVPAWGGAFGGELADYQERCIANEHILADRIDAIGEQVSGDGLSDDDDLGIAGDMFRGEEDAGLRGQSDRKSVV